MRNALIMAVMAVAAAFPTGCSEEDSPARPPLFGACSGGQGEACATYLPTVQPAAILLPGENDDSTLWQFQFQNTGGDDAQVLNVYLAEGSNQYVSMEWAVNDPSDVGAYTSGDSVQSCIPDPSTSPDPAQLPPAVAGTASANCVFPQTIEGFDEATASSGRLSFLLRNTYQTGTDVADNSPVIIIVQVDYREDDLVGSDGVLRIEIPVEECGADLQASPFAVDFTSDGTTITTQDIRIDNVGCEDLEILDIQLLNSIAGSPITLELPLPIGAVIPPQTDPAYEPVSFTVTFNPDGAPAGVQNTVRVTTNDSVNPNLDIQVTTDTCPVDFSFDFGEGGLENSYLDFTAVEAGTMGSQTVRIENTGECSLSLIDLELDTSLQGITGGPYQVEFLKNGENIGFLGVVGGGAPPLPVVMGNVGDVVEVVVTFEAIDGETPEPAELGFSFRSGGGALFDRSVWMYASDAADMIIVPSNDQAQQLGLFTFAAEPGQFKTKTFAIQNRGLSPVMVDNVTVRNQFDQAVEDFKLLDGGPVTGGLFSATEVPALSSLPLTIEYSPISGSFDSKAFVRIYPEGFEEGGADPTPFVVNLQGYGYSNNELPGLPEANPGESMTVPAGTLVTLSGSGTGNDATISPDGYKWWISAKPEGSAAQLDDQGDPNVAFNADVPGDYVVHLVVFGTDSENALLFSDEATLTITAE